MGGPSGPVDHEGMGRPVLIIGGGIGGLTAALALSRRGIECEVHERAPELREIGAGLGVWPAALRALDSLGIGDEVRARGGRILPSGMRDEDGSTLVQIDVPDVVATFGEPPIGIHRGELQSLLLGALPSGTVRVGRELIDLSGHDRAGDVVARFADGSEAIGSAVVGADGGRSQVRSILFGHRELHDCGYVGWRGTSDLVDPDLDGCWGEWWGRHGRFGFLPIGGGRITWYATVRELHDGGSKEEVVERFSTFARPVPEIIESTAPERIWVDRVRDLAPLRRWTVGRATLLGDAAHPMTPELGQGACQAIIDAAVLAEELSSTSDLGAALLRYERRRHRRTAFIQLAARGMAAGGNIEGPRIQGVRRRLVGVMSPRMAMREFALVAGR